MSKVKQKSGRPPFTPKIYKNGAVKTGKALEDEIKRIAGLSFDELMLEGLPATKDFIEKCRSLAKDIEINLEERLDRQND